MTLLKTALAATILTATMPAAATDFSFTGAFTRDNGQQWLIFTIDTDTTVTMRSWSYAGGMNAAGETIARGGFDPILTLFDGDGWLIGTNENGACTDVAADINGQCRDTYFTIDLAAGLYGVSITQYDNLPVGLNLMAGFKWDHVNNYTPLISGCAIGQGQFEDTSGGDHCQRDGHWAFDILNVGYARTARDGPIPEPATWAMMMAGFGLIGAAMRRRARTVRFAA